MKKTFFGGCLILVLVSCNNGKKQQVTSNEQRATSNEQQATTDILGEWFQNYAVIDQNANAVLDPEDRNGTKSQMGFNYFQFNEDGKCLYDSDMKFKGTYEIIEDNGKRKLHVTVNGFGETYKYTIVDPVTDELILFSSGVFMFFKKK